MTGSDKRKAAIRSVLAEIAAAADLPFSVRLWDGEIVPLGASASADLCVAIRSPGVLSDLLRHPTLDRLVRHYATGGIALEGGTLLDLAAGHDSDPNRRRLFGRLNKLRLARAALPFLAGRREPPDGGQDLGGNSTRTRGSGRPEQDYIRFHYDLSNEFYGLFLDPWMQYSCAYFPSWETGLDQAQEAKLDMICRKLRLGPGDRFLDIGCGWGGLVLWAARHYGVTAHGVTLSREQHALACRRIEDAGLGDRATVEIRDFREIEGRFDKIASIGMFEHVGIDNHPAYFRKIHALLEPRGLLLNHAITRRGKTDLRRFRRKKREYRAITRYIFPGGEVDHIGHSLTMLEAHGFEVHDVENWREHYALTAEHWCRRLDHNQTAAMAAIGPHKTRLWLLYLAGVALGFRRGSIQIFQTVASRRTRGPSGLPPTRADLYR